MDPLYEWFIRQWMNERMYEWMREQLNGEWWAINEETSICYQGEPYQGDCLSWFRSKITSCSAKLCCRVTRSGAAGHIPQFKEPIISSPSAIHAPAIFTASANSG